MMIDQRFFLILLIHMISCASVPMGHFTVVSNKNISDLNQISNHVDGPVRVSGESCIKLITFIAIGSATAPNLNDAFMDALKNNHDANALSDITIKRSELFTFFYNKFCYLVEGTPIQLKK